MKAQAVRRLAAALFMLASAAGCAPTSLRQTAETAPRRHFQIAAGGDGVLFRDSEEKTKLPLMNAAVDVRYGVLDNLDVGVRVMTLGGGLNTKVRAVHLERFSLSIAPGVYFGHTPKNTLFNFGYHLWFDVPVIIGTPIAQDLSVNFGPRVVGELFFPRGGTKRYGGWFGSFVNVDWRVGRGFHFIPEMVFNGSTGNVAVKGIVATAGAGVMKDF